MEESRDDSAQETGEEKKERSYMESIYEYLPFTYSQVDLFVKVMTGVTVVFLIFAVIMSNR